MLKKLTQRLKQTRANLGASILTLLVKQKATEKAMRIFTIQRIWRHWALPLHVECHDIKFLSTKIIRVGVLCFQFELETQNLKHQDLVEENLEQQLKEV